MLPEARSHDVHASRCADGRWWRVGGSALPAARHPAVGDLEVQPSREVLHRDDRARWQGPHRGPATFTGQPLCAARLQSDVRVRSVRGLCGRSGNRCHAATLGGGMRRRNPGPATISHRSLSGHASVTGQRHPFRPPRHELLHIGPSHVRAVPYVFRPPSNVIREYPGLPRPRPEYQAGKRDADPASAPFLSDSGVCSRS